MGHTPVFIEEKDTRNNERPRDYHQSRFKEDPKLAEEHKILLINRENICDLLASETFTKSQTGKSFVPRTNNERFFNFLSKKMVWKDKEGNWQERNKISRDKKRNYEYKVFESVKGDQFVIRTLMEQELPQSLDSWVSP